MTEPKAHDETIEFARHVTGNEAAKLAEDRGLPIEAIRVDNRPSGHSTVYIKWPRD